MVLIVDNQPVEVEKIYDCGWDGIVFFAAPTTRYFFSDLGWHGGGYVERVNEITEAEYQAFRQRGEAPRPR
jgi:hypothetical protein